MVIARENVKIKPSVILSLEGQCVFDNNYYGTEDEDISAKEPLPDLCHKCGRCCRSATTFHSYKKLQQMEAEGNQEAIDFLSIFEPYDSIEDARQVEPDQVAHVISVVETRNDMSMEELTFYHCRFVSPEGLCGIYERRPRCCREAPGNGWSGMPPGCGFEGWQFAQREKQKRMIRDLKTSYYLMEQLSPDGVSHPVRQGTTLAELKEAISEKIQPWQRFGADNW